MNIGLYFRQLVEACRRTTHDAEALRRFFLRHEEFYSDEERRWVRMTVSVASWPSMAYSLLQERRAEAGFDADPNRLTKQPGMVGVGCRALMFPSFFMSHVRHGDKKRVQSPSYSPFQFSSGRRRPR